MSEFAIILSIVFVYVTLGFAVAVFLSKLLEIPSHDKQTHWMLFVLWPIAVLSLAVFGICLLLQSVRVPRFLDDPVGAACKFLERSKDMK